MEILNSEQQNTGQPRAIVGQTSCSDLESAHSNNNINTSNNNNNNNNVLPHVLKELFASASPKNHSSVLFFNFFTLKNNYLKNVLRKLYFI